MDRPRTPESLTATEVPANEKDASDGHEVETIETKDLEINSGETAKLPEKESSGSQVGEPPDGGLTAWLQVLASMLFFFNTWGLINAFGVFQTYYDATLSRPPSDVAWIGTFQAFLLLFVSAMCGPIYDKGYLRSLVVVGTFLVSFGLMMTSLSGEYYQVFLAQSVVVGLGSGCLQIPSLALPAQYFSRKRALAIGTGATGGSLGAVIYPIVFRRLQVQVSFGWATRALGFIALGTLALASALSKSRLPPSKNARALVDTSALRNRAFMLLTFGIFLYLMGIYMPFFYISTWANAHLGLDAELSFYMFTIMNVGSIFGRVIPGLLADRYGSLNILITTIVISSILIFAWISVARVANLVVFCLFYGFFSGASVSLPGTVIARICPNLDKVGTWLGMCFSIASLGLLIGNPIAGALIKMQPEVSFVASQCFAGATVIAGGVCLCGLRYMLRAKKV